MCTEQEVSSQSTGRQRISRSKLSCCLIAVTFVLLGASSLYADSVAVAVTGSDLIDYRSSGGGGITATEQWANGGFELSWEITYNELDSDYTYKYWITGAGGDPLEKDLSHWMLQLTSSVDWGDLFDEVGVNEVRTFSPDDPGNSNPGLLSDIFGVKFDFGGDVVHIEFTTEQAPVWGDFYAGGGKDKGNDIYAYNDGFGTDPDLDFSGFIARPDGATSVPEPSTLVLLLSGMGVLAGAARFRKKT